MYYLSGPKISVKTFSVQEKPSRIKSRNLTLDKMSQQKSDMPEVKQKVFAIQTLGATVYQ